LILMPGFVISCSCVIFVWICGSGELNS
jgi:hypothetical protein